ncbi:zinc finger (c3hc4 ring finger) domain-containing protein [Cyclospora cayetanensis]|uniref:Zinc finger (C3hc4 ring finger) domain-containing protein n=1 Tax=Cyclospora cayetanensis TaxID=88456 RepID=A0A1D3D2C3_9EIME|nr:zinc finger (c3hc4 ring finger) domain-containing protein [Cyclospora cayetanensis]
MSPKPPQRQKQGKHKAPASSARETSSQYGGSTPGTFGGSTQLEAIFAQFARSDSREAAAITGASATAATTSVPAAADCGSQRISPYAREGVSGGRGASLALALASTLPANVHVVLTRLTKKDGHTRSRGLVELQELLQHQLDAEAVESLLPQLVFVYRSLALGDGEAFPLSLESTPLPLAGQPEIPGAAAAAYPVKDAAANQTRRSRAGAAAEVTEAAAAATACDAFNKGLQRRIAAVEHCKAALLEELLQLLLMPETQQQQQHKEHQTGAAAVSSSRHEDECAQLQLDRHVDCAAFLARRTACL